MFFRTVVMAGVGGFLVLLAVLAYLNRRDTMSGKQLGLAIGGYLGLYMTANALGAALVTGPLTVKGTLIALALGVFTGLTSYAIARSAFEARPKE